MTVQGLDGGFVSGVDAAGRGVGVEVFGGEGFVEDGELWVL